MATKPLTENPCLDIPPYLVAIAGVIARSTVGSEFVEVTVELVEKILRCYWAMCPSKLPMSREEALRATCKAIGWRGNHIVNKAYPLEGASHSVRAFYVGRTAYCIAGDEPASWKRYKSFPDDPLSKPGRWASHGDADNLRTTRLVERWWARTWEKAFGEPPPMKVRYTSLQGYLFVTRCGAYALRMDATNNMDTPIRAVELYDISISAEALARIRRAGLTARKGFVPLDVIEDDQGNPERIVAFVLREDTILLESHQVNQVSQVYQVNQVNQVGPDDLTDLTT